MEVARSVEAQSVTGRVKWYDATKGFGFIESEALQGDVMIHRSKLFDQSKRLPEGAILEFEYFHGERGWQVERVISIDLSRAVDLPTRRKPAASAQEYLTKAGEFERCTVKWFHHERGFGFLVRQSDGQDVFVHAAALTVANLRNELAPGDEIEARVRHDRQGLDRAVRAEGPVKWVIADTLFVPVLVLLMVGAGAFIETFGATLLLAIVGTVFMGALSWYSK